MKRIILCLSLCSVYSFAADECPGPAEINLNKAQVLILVEGQSWSSANAKLNVYLKGANGFWTKSKDDALVNQEAYIGENGMGWGHDYHPQIETDPTQKETGDQYLKIEGDHKSPAGVFRIGKAFGVASRETSANYIQIMQKVKPNDDTKDMRIINGKKMIPNKVKCSDDVTKPSFYDKIWRNDITAFVGKDTGELLGSNKLYTCGLNVLTGSKVDHQIQKKGEGSIAENILTGTGSCIFMHHFDEKLFAEKEVEVRSKCHNKTELAICRNQIELQPKYHEAGHLATYGCTVIHQNNMCHLMEFIERSKNRQQVAFATLPKSELQKSKWRSCFPGVDLPEIIEKEPSHEKIHEKSVR